MTLDDLRRSAVAQSLFTPTTLQRALDALGFVQADPIRAPARAQDLTLRHRVTGYRAGDRELATWALAAWQRSAGPTLRFEQASEKQALLRVYWADPADGQYGEMVPFTIGEQRGAALYIRPDTAALGPEIARHTRGDPLLRDSIVYLTCLHELGHALGLHHTDVFAEIMYSFQFGGDLVEYFMRYRRQLRSRADIAAVSGLAASDIEHLRALYSARQPLLRLPFP